MIRKIVSGLVEVEKYISAVMVGTLTILNIASVIMRYAFNRPIMWCEEMSLLLFMWFVFGSLISITYRRGAVSLDFFVDMMPDKIRRTVQLLVDSFTAGLFITTAVFCVNLIERSSFRTTAILQISYLYIYLPILIGFGFSAVILMMYIYDDIHGLFHSRQKEAPL